jgi:hypothetical protein
MLSLFLEDKICSREKSNISSRKCIVVDLPKSSILYRKFFGKLYGGCSKLINLNEPVAMSSFTITESLR